MTIWNQALKEVGNSISDDMKKWRYRINRAIKKRKPHAEQWKLNEDYISLERFKKRDQQIFLDVPAKNKTRAFINNRVASFVFKNPRFILTPSTPMSSDIIQVQTIENGQQIVKEIQKHRVAEAILNFIIQQPSFGADRVCRRMAKASLVSMGVAKVGFKADFGNGYETDEKYLFNEDTLSFPTDPGLDDGRDDNGVPTNLIPSSDGRPFPIQPLTEKWFWDWMPAKQMLYDYNSGVEFYDHDWVACEYHLPLKEIKESEEFNEKAREAVVAVADDGTEMNPFGDDDEEYSAMGRIFVIHDNENDEVLIMADGGTEFLKRGEFPKGVQHSPYVNLRPDEEQEGFYPHPVTTDLRPINQEIDRWHLLDLQGGYENIPKWGYREGDIEDDQLDALFSPIPNEAIKFKKTAPDDLRHSLRSIERSTTPPDHYMRLQRLEQDFDEIAGQSGESRGVGSTNLATGVAAIEHHAQIREDDHRTQLAAALNEMGKKTLDSLQANMTKDQAVTIVGEDGESFVSEVSREMIQGDFDVSVGVEDMMPRSSNTELSQTIQMATVFGQYPLLGADEAVSGVLLDKAHINAPGIRKGLANMAKMSLQMQTGANEADVLGNKEPVETEGQLVQQNAGN